MIVRSDNYRAERGLMFDTVSLRLSKSRPLAYTLRERGFTKPYNSAGANYFRNIPVNDACMLKLNWYRTLHADYLSAEVSLPKLVFGNNVEMLSSADVPKALELVSNLVSYYSGADFDATKADVIRLDVCNNWKSQEVDVYARLEALKSAHYPKMTRRPVEASVYFRNKGKKKSQEVVCYAKHAHIHELVRKGEATDEHLKASIGVFRLEHRYFDDAVTRLASDRLLLADRSAASLLKAWVAEEVIKTDMQILGLDKEISNGDARLERLREYCNGDRAKLVRLSGILTLADKYGADNLVSLDLVRHTSFYEYRKELKAAGVWLTAPAERTLAPLSEPDFNNDSLPMSNTYNLVQPAGLITSEWVN